MHEWHRLYLGGQWRAPAGDDVIDVLSPHDQSLVGRTPRAVEADVDAAVEAARRAFDEGPWPRLAPQQRIEALERVAALYAQRVDELCALITAEMGSPRWFAQLGQASGALDLLRRDLEHARTYPWEERRGRSMVRREPVGVVGLITPWNVPQLAIIAKLVPALLAGCTVVVKPSPESPLDAMVLAEVLEQADLPEGLVSVLPGGGDAGRRLVEHPGVDKIAFTGSSQVGRWIGASCGQSLKRCTLELGGKSAAIVLDDAGLERTVEGLRFASFMNNGQACVAQSRILVSRRRYAEVVEALGAMVAEMTVGDPSGDAYVGPLVSRAHQARVQQHIADAVADGVTVTAGGPAPILGLEHGNYVRPTLFSDVSPDMRIAREEVFGPVVAVIPYADEQDAVRIANASEYGLAGSVWTGSRAHGLEIAKQVRTGTFGINAYAPDVGVPFGGFKASGIGREYGPEGFDAYVELKSVYGVPA